VCTEAAEQLRAADAEGQTPASDSLASQAVRGSVYSVAASAVTLTSGFLRAILLARLLLPEHFGVVTLAMFYVTLANQFFALGLDHAFLHRQDVDEKVRATYFSLRVGTVTVVLLLIGIASPALSTLYPTMPLLRSVLLCLAGLGVIQGVNYVQETTLRKELAFRQLATMDVVASVVMTLVAPTLAWAGWGVWALVAEQVSGILTRTVMNWLLLRREAWRLAWHGSTVRWFLQYGKPMWVASNLYFLTDRFDDFWIGTTLGKTLLGYYSRAYEFAHYPRRVIATPLLGVFTPVFAKLQDDRLRLSQAFYRAAYVILRISFFASGAFALIMPEFIHLVIGEQWMPMLLTFRLMLVYTLLDVMIVFGEGLLWAVGRPGHFQRVVLAQAVFFVPAVVLGAYLGEINGVALAADAMLIVGCIVLYRYLRQVVDFSLRRLTLWPSVALIAGQAVGLLMESQWRFPVGWATAAAKLGVFAALYLALLFLAERQETLQGLRWAWAGISSTQLVGTR
jgi:O-antigen/teichoic acid export membrane protein